jgi:hypothetical protein
MGLRDLVLGPRCDSCGRRGQDVVSYRSMRMDLHPGCKRALHRADTSQPYGSRAAGYRAGSGQPVKIAGPMGGRYTGPAAKDQRRK